MNEMILFSTKFIEMKIELDDINYLWAKLVLATK